MKTHRKEFGKILFVMAGVLWGIMALVSQINAETTPPEFERIQEGTSWIYFVPSGTGMVEAAVDQAADGDIIELVTSGGMYLDTNSVEIEGKSITVRARPGLAEKPIVKNDEAGESNGVFRLKAGGNLTLKGLEIQHAKYLIRVDNDSTPDAKLIVDDVYGHTAVENWIKVYAGSWLDSIIVRNSTFRDCEKAGVYLRYANTIGYAEFTNNTFVKSGREAIHVEDNPNTVFRVNHCTFDSISWNDGNRMLYPKGVLDAEIKNSVFTNHLGVPAPHSDAVRIFGNSTLTHSDFYNTGGVNLEDSATLSDTLARNPEYTDPTNGDYTLMAGSPVLGQADDGKAMGDLKWDPGYHVPQIIPVKAGTDALNNAVAAAVSGDIIELVTNGGLYYETSSVELENKDLTIRARAGLTQKPIIQNDDAGESNGVLRVKAGSSLKLQGVEVQHAKYLVRVDNDSTPDAKLILDDINAHTAAEAWVKIYAGAWLDSLIIRNSIFQDAGKEGIYLKEPNTIDYAEFDNSTFINVGREAIRMRDNPDAVVRMNHCTFDSISTGGDYRMVYPEGVADVQIKNSMFTNQLGTHSDAVKIFGNSTLSFANFWQAQDVATNDAATATDTSRFDPLYNNPSVDDYRLADASSARGAADDGNALGDLRWEVSPGEYYLTLLTEGNGYIQADPDQEVYASGTDVTLQAQPDYKWALLEWTGDVGAIFPPDLNPITITMDANKTVTAVFENMAPKYPVTANVVGFGHVEISPEPDEDGKIEEKTEVTLTAVSDTTSMAFTGWSGDTITTDNPITITVTDTFDVTATFEPVVSQDSLKVVVVGNGDVNLSPEPYADYGTYDTGTTVAMEAVAVPGWEFVDWAGDTTSTNNPIDVVMDSTIEITATFQEQAITGGRLEIDETWDMLEAVEFANNNSQVDTLMLMTSGGVYTTTDDDLVRVTSPLVLLAAPGLAEKPVVTNSDPTGDRLEIIEISDEFYVEGVVFDGGHEQSHGMKYALTVDNLVSETPDITIRNCDFLNIFQEKDPNKDGHALKFYADVVAGDVLIEDSYFDGAGYEAIRISETEKYATDRALASLTVRNSTFTNIDAECIRYYSDVDPSTPDAPVLIENLTIENSATRTMYLKNSGGAIVRNIIVANSRLSGHGRDGDILDAQGNGDVTSYVSHIDTFNVKADADIKSTDGEVDTTTLWGIDPMFADAANHDYTLTAASHLYGLGHEGATMGDLNWATAEPTHVYLEITAENGAVVTAPTPIGLTYDPGTVVTLTAVPDSGYVFTGWSGDLSGETNPATITMDGDKSVEAVFDVEVGVDPENLPEQYSLEQNYPNPFNPGTQIKFALKESGFTNIAVYDLLGRQVATVVNKEMQAGYHNVYFDGSLLSSGVYFYKIQSGDYVSVKKMILMK
ncbi:MAG: right-handed parallel beta-helix repeat-containing protein [Candidatus Marinimicrobia bacterium]|nr:right-handed parallel beta-helix repeat-containing protein [Candidatus Neomarinimicrobiota bacterium]MCF7828919.1 right-handed parallel beta-helix repeat-containing protein [Candidatus Neomarinimicrobiota bacterium]MCF7879879.1 right-handed parallel beta-helix repeat-containing protein [Candidatus Neomarinimicrobiota bacterium]